MENDGVCKVDRQNKNVLVLERVGEGRIMLEMPAEGCSRRNGKWEESLRQKKILDDRQHYDKWMYENMKRKAEKRVQWRMLSLQ